MGAVQAAFPDQVAHGLRDESSERSSARSERANLPRGGGIRLDVEEDDSLGLVELLEYRIESLSRIPRPRRHRKPGALEHGIGLLPREEVAELVRAHDEERIVE